MSDALCRCTKTDHHCDCAVHDSATALIAERDRLKAVIDMIAESVIVRHVCLPNTPVVQGCCQTTWGCGICNGEFHREGDREWYDHASWCPRKATR